MPFQKISYSTLNSRQKEVFNFQKAAGVLAEYGFNCMKLDDDWNGADFLADHISGTLTLRVQLKGRTTIGRKYMAKNLHMMFPLSHGWVLVEHDLLLRLVEEHTNWTATDAWVTGGLHHSASPNAPLVAALQLYMLTAEATATLAE